VGDPVGDTHTPLTHDWLGAQLQIGSSHWSPRYSGEHVHVPSTQRPWPLQSPSPGHCEQFEWISTMFCVHAPKMYASSTHAQ